ncbi:Hsp20/alpha crystallin family protein [Effusibacillus lacus]|uniref:Heat-shock protein Hsp20 n=1 Tax=Effusibacillus lacus TaxID=1348429 RepID=A0A292YQU8_9BACL|nr:Hsp20/alpha crystallin family protein [Effusibacillus lacus]TCS72581.1 HSP20 family protein [Effusibacillus lacus]GAX90860.1 heat-shock protein Hsp20 [Effusibacillus lacus]
MPLIPYEPFRHLENMRRELDRFFATDFPALRTGFGQNLGTPSIDIYETENELVATCDIPGVEKKEDILIDIDNNILSVSGTINRLNEIKEENMHRQERFVGRFHRSVTLPTRVSSEGVKASYKNGVLEIRMPKLTGENKKRIDVDFH